MITYEMEDVISVLQNCAPYLIALGIALLVGITVFIAVRRRPRPQKFLIRAQAGLAMVLALVLAVNGIMLGGVSALLDLALTDQAEISQETMSSAEQTALQIAEEGFVCCKTMTTPCPSPM